MYIWIRFVKEKFLFSLISHFRFSFVDFFGLHLLQKLIWLIAFCVEEESIWMMPSCMQLIFHLSRPSIPSIPPPTQSRRNSCIQSSCLVVLAWSSFVCIERILYLLRWKIIDLCNTDCALVFPWKFDSPWILSTIKWQQHASILLKIQ